MKYQVDIKSIFIGFLGSALLFATFSFKQEPAERENRYKTTMGQHGVVILDTKTGEYIMNTDVSSRGWRKGSFATTPR